MYKYKLLKHSDTHTHTHMNTHYIHLSGKRYVIHIDLIRWSPLSNIQKRGRTNHRGFGENDHIPWCIRPRKRGPILEKVD